MNPKTYKIITIILLIAVVLLTGYILTRKPSTDNSIEQHLKLQSDSIQKVLVSVKDSADKKEKLYLSKIDSIVNHQKRVRENINSITQSEIIRVRELPIDDALFYFTDKVVEEGDYPRKILKGEDTLIEITVGQLIEANTQFIENENLFYLKDTLDSELDVVYKLLDESKEVLDTKNKQINVLNELLYVKGSIISTQDKTILELKKTHRKQMFLNTLIGAGVGSILGAIFIK